MLKRVKGSKDLEHSGQLAGTTEWIKEAICEGMSTEIGYRDAPAS